MIYEAIDNVAKTTVNNAFDTAKKATLSLDINYRETFWGYLRGVWVYMSAISAGPAPTKITMRICKDAAGDEILITDTEADISTGITVANKGSVVYLLDIPCTLSTETLYLFAKTDTGTVTIDKVVLSWERK